MRGSKFELRFDSKGLPTNEEDIRQALKKKPGNGSSTAASSIQAATGMGGGTTTTVAPNEGSRSQQITTMPSLQNFQ